MKTAYPLLSLLSASMVVAAPAPFVGTGPVVAAGTENVVIPTTNFGRREAAVVEDFGKRALQLRGALLAARGGQGKGNAKNADAQAGEYRSNLGTFGLIYCQMQPLMHRMLTRQLLV